MKVFNILIFLILVSFIPGDQIGMTVHKSFTIDSLGACQGISWQGKIIYLYGDRETGILKEYQMGRDSLIEIVNSEIKFTVKGEDVINHPTGIAHNGVGPTFIGNSIRLNAEGTKWKAVIYCVNWKGLLKSHTLDGNLINTIEDDACIQGTRPEYVKYKDKWYVATADYGNHGNEVRLYNPSLLSKTTKTSNEGVLFKKFSCSPWVQNLLWIPEKGLLLLIQNQIEGRKWRFTYLDLAKSISSGKEVVVKEVDIANKQDELEGFALSPDHQHGIAVTSSRKNNINLMNIKW